MTPAAPDLATGQAAPDLPPGYHPTPPERRLRRQNAVHAIVDAGRPAEPRGLPTIEVLGATLTLTDPRRRLTARAMAATQPGPLAAALNRWYDRLDHGTRPREETRR